jgi:Helix-turn-helix domain
VSEEKIGGIMIPFCILDCEPLTVCEKLVWSYLFAFQANGVRCFAGVDTIAKKLGFSSISIRRAVASLKKNKLLVKGKWTTSEGKEMDAYHCLNVNSVPQVCKALGLYQNDTTGSSLYQNDTETCIKMIQPLYQNDTHNNNTNNKSNRKSEDQDIGTRKDLVKNQDTKSTNTHTYDPKNSLSKTVGHKSKKVGVDTGIVLTKNDEPPGNVTDLPKAKRLRFEGDGKEEVIGNVWLSIIEVERLKSEFGEETTYAGLKSAHEWSINENPYKGKPAYKAWHEKTNHYCTVRNLIKRSLAAGKVAALGFGGFEFEYSPGGSR